MTTLKRTLSGKNVAVANADVFVVPNTACTVNGYYCDGERRKNYISDLAKANGKEFNPETDKLIELWFVSDDLDSDNMMDHGFAVTYNDERYRCHTVSRFFSRLPAQLLPTKEDETILITVPCKGTHCDRQTGEDKEIEFELQLSVTAKQLNYRYRRFGTFEDTIRQVI